MTLTQTEKEIVLAYRQLPAGGRNAILRGLNLSDLQQDEGTSRPADVVTLHGKGRG